MLPSTLEWHAAAMLLAVAALFWGPALAGTAGMLSLSLLVAGLQAAQARLPAEHDGLTSRLLVAALCYAQPLVRSWKRYGTRLLSYRPPAGDAALEAGARRPMPLTGTLALAYWSEEGCARTQLLARVLAYLDRHRWGKAIDTGWSSWDVRIYCHRWTVVELCTAEEDHAGGKRLLRVRYRLRAGGYFKALGWTAAAAAPCAVALQAWGVAGGAAALLAVCAALWWRGARRAARALAVVEAAARDLGLMPCE
jgi:hypothetical protein